MRQPRFRKARLEALKAKGVTPTRKQPVWNVQITALPVLPAWVNEKRIRGLASIWLKPKDAYRLFMLDRRMGGNPTIVKSVYRYCDHCGRALLDVDAQRLRERLETGEALCGPQCERDRRMGLWKVLGELKAA